jgi:hypothetical protein
LNAQLGVETVQVLADAGYYNSEDPEGLRGEDDRIVAYGPPQEGNGKLDKQGRFSRKDFNYNADADVYRCPAGELLRTTKKP